MIMSILGDKRIVYLSELEVQFLKVFFEPVTNVWIRDPLPLLIRLIYHDEGHVIIWLALSLLSRFVCFYSFLSRLYHVCVVLVLHLKYWLDLIRRLINLSLKKLHRFLIALECVIQLLYKDKNYKHSYFPSRVGAPCYFQ